jgi:hypothetical protein
MTRLRDSTTVDLSPEQARAGIERFFVSLEGSDGISRMRLRVPTDGAPHGYAISLDREVRIEAEIKDPVKIRWVPEGSTIFPIFEGELHLSPNGESRRTVIELDGAYTPPFGPAGQIFDAAIGHRIAKRTAYEFLKDLKAAVEKS